MPTPFSPTRWGILADGPAARPFARGLAALPDASLHAVAAGDEAAAREFVEGLGASVAHPSPGALVADPEVDIVYVATAPARHAADCRLVLEAGKPVVCGPPLGLDAGEAGRVVALARERGLFCMEATWMRFLPLVAEARDLVRSGAIGRPRLLTADFGRAVAPDPRDRPPGPPPAGGCLLGRGVYPLALAHLLFGVPDAVSGHATAAEDGADQTVAITLQYADGPVAMLGSSLMATAGNLATVLGTRGSITIHAPSGNAARVTVDRRDPSAAWAVPGPSADPDDRQRLTDAIRETVFGQPRIGPARVGRRGGRRTTVRIEAGNGCHHEAAEAMRCLRAGLTESPLMPLDATLAVRRTLDRLRRDWGIAYPAGDAGSST